VTSLILCFSKIWKDLYISFQTLASSSATSVDFHAVLPE
jgi:hypothetical protein